MSRCCVNAAMSCCAMTNGARVNHHPPVKRDVEPHKIDTNSCANRATEMDITMIGLQNAGKTSLLKVLAVSYPCQSLSSSLKIWKLISLC